MKLGVGRVEYGLLHFIKEYIQSRGLLRQDFSTTQGRKRVEYQTEDHFWQDVMRSGQIYETCRVTLKDFLLCQWIPRAPGQYHTSEARAYRSRAEHYVRERSRGFVVYDPYGKSEMVKGGVGCLRLAQKQIGNESLHFLCATSSGITHKGLLVGLRRDLYEKLIEDIERYGGISCAIVGQIRYWSCENMLPTYTPRHLPRMYLYAEKLGNVQKVTEPSKFDVTAAVLFRGNIEDEEGTFFVYSHFHPGKHGSLEHTIEQCVNWMEKSYVRGLYDGKVLTDFDEVVPRFDDVSFPLKALMNPDTNASSVLKMCSNLHERRGFIDWDSLQGLVTQIFIEQPTETNINISKINTMNNKEGNTYNQSGNFGIGHQSGGTIEGGAKVAGVINEAEQQNLAEAAAQIQQLLEQLDKSYPANTTAGKLAIATEAIKQIEANPTLMARVLSAISAGGASALESFLNHPAASFVIGALQDWQETGKAQS